MIVLQFPCLKYKTKQIHQPILNFTVMKFEKEKEWESDMKKWLELFVRVENFGIESINHYLTGTKSLKRLEINSFFKLNTILNTLKS